MSSDRSQRGDWPGREEWDEISRTYREASHTPPPPQGFLNRVLDRVARSDTVRSAASIAGVSAVAAGVGAAVLGSAIAASAGVSSYDAQVGAAYPPIHVAALAQGTARPDYGFYNLSVEAMADSKGDFRMVHAAEDSAPSRGALALKSMLSEMRLLTSSPIVVHAYDPFVKDASGKVGLDMAGLREVVPEMAKDGVKVAMVPFSVSASPAGIELSKILKDNGIAMVAPVTDRGVENAPDIISVQAESVAGNYAPRGNLMVYGRETTAVGQVAGSAAVYGAMYPGLKGSTDMGSEMQARIILGTQLQQRIGTGAHRHVATLQAMPGVSFAKEQLAAQVKPSAQMAASIRAMQAAQGMHN